MSAKPDSIKSILYALFAIIAESVSLWGCTPAVNKERYGRRITRWFRESRSSELIVVFGEDIAALLGLVLALLAVLARPSPATRFTMPWGLSRLVYC